MIPLKYQVVGEEDYAFSIQIDNAGEFLINTGTYTSHPPRKGTLTEAQETQLMGALKALGTPQAHPMPAGGNAFEAELVIGEVSEEVRYPFWEGALEDDQKLQELVRLLEKI